MLTAAVSPISVCEPMRNEPNSSVCIWDKIFSAATSARPADALSYTLHEALCWTQTCLQSRMPSLPTRRCACLLLRSASSQLRRLCKEQNRTWREQLRMSRRSNENPLLGYSHLLPPPPLAMLVPAVSICRYMTAMGSPPAIALHQPSTQGRLAFAGRRLCT